jgi:kumamolisin
MGSLADLGASGTNRMVEIAICLRYRNEDGLKALVAAQADPRSPWFKRFLSPRAFLDRYGPSRTGYDRVIASLRRLGFTVEETFPNRSVVIAAAPAPQADRAFQTEIHEFAQPGYGVRYANVRSGTVPADIADVVSGVTGFSNIHAFTTHLRYGRTAASFPADRGALALGIIGPDGGYGPVVFSKSYDMLNQVGVDGAGRTGAIVTDGDFLDSDLAAFLAYYGIVRSGQTVRVPLSGGANGGMLADSDEATLDVETLASQAPGADIYVYEGEDFSNPAHLIAAYNQLVSDDRAEEANASLGYCEAGFGDLPAMAEQIAIQGSALGITFHASTGDDGPNVYGCFSGVNVATPADAPHVTSVGGTDLLVNAATGMEVAEYAWIDDPYGATGGGVSTVFALPDFQSGVPNVHRSGRNLPDVAFAADPDHGASFYFRGQFRGPLGGTSLASPIFGAAVLQLNQQNAARSGWITPLIYGAWQRVGYGSGAHAFFRDMVFGSNGNAIAPGDRVSPGYDRTTGIGAVLFGNSAVLLNPSSPVPGR